MTSCTVPLPAWEANNLFDSDEYTVVCSSSLYGTVYEIVEKRCSQEVILIGASAHAFEIQRQRWNEVVPAEDDVHAVLAGYMSLGRLPLYIH